MAGRLIAFLHKHLWARRTAAVLLAVAWVFCVIVDALREAVQYVRDEYPKFKGRFLAAWYWSE